MEKQWGENTSLESGVILLTPGGEVVDCAWMGTYDEPIAQSRALVEQNIRQDAVALKNFCRLNYQDWPSR